MLAWLHGLLPEGFHFLRPEWFWLLLPLALMVALLVRRREAGAGWQKVCDPHLLPHLLEGAATARRARWPLWLLSLAWLAAVVALAGPVWQKLPQPVYQSEEARVVVLDLSRSMDATDVAPSRLARARFKLLDILKRSDVGQTALVVFAGDAYVVSPLTQDANTIAAMVPALETAIMPVQGSRADLALLKADALFDQGGAPEGEIILITDGVNEKALSVAREIAAKGRRLAVLAVGTAEGGPVPVEVGGFLKDRHGAIVIPRLDVARLSELAAAGGGVFSPMRNDDSDIDLIMNQLPLPGWDAARQKAELDTEQWREEGPWLLLGLIPLALLAFRRGALMALVLTFYLLQPDPAMAAWEDLWARPDQQGARLLQQGRAGEAAKRFEDPAWRASAAYRAGDFDEAAELFGQLDSADGHYNRANALARQGRLEEALAEYDRALELDDRLDDARFNRQLVEELLKQQQQQSSQEGEGNEQDQSDPSGQNGQDQSQSQPDQPDQSGEGVENPPGGDGALDGPQQAPASDGQGGEGQTQQDQPQMDQAQRDRGESDQAQDAGQDQGRGGEEDSDQTQGQHDSGAGQAVQEEAPGASEDQQALEQWLRRVPDDPGGLLRRKFLYQYQRQRAQGKDQQTEEAW
ncbi:MAG TPA: VWA domain-containing protein [Anaerolineae bacterium]|nr:VWA domain-containing protein [Anaerolineae bacterium]